MTYEDALTVLAGEDKLRAEIFAIRRLLTNHGFCTESEIQRQVVIFARSTYGSDIVTRLQWIAGQVASEHNTTLEAIRARHHRPENVRPRQLFCYLVRALTDQSLPQIGKYLGLHHSTILHSINVIAGQRMGNHKMDLAIQRISSEFADRWPA